MPPYTICLCGCSRTEHRLAEVLSGCAKIERCSVRKAPPRNSSADFLLYESAVLPPACTAQGILILGSRLCNKPFLIPEQFIPVFDSANDRAVRLLTRSHRNGISCGCAPQNTLSLASLSDTQAVISLQRSLVTLSGRILEPRDLTVQLRRPHELFELMAACAVLLLTDHAADGQISLFSTRKRLFS